jgi:PAS domain S-box-containing protein
LLATASTVLVVAGLTLTKLPLWLSVVIGLLVGSLLTTQAIPLARGGIDRRIAALTDAVRSYGEQDYSMRVAEQASSELSDLIVALNQLGDRLRRTRQDSMQRLALLDALLQQAPMGVVLIDEQGYVTYANRSAWRLFGAGERLEGRSFEAALAAAPGPLRLALARNEDGITRLPSHSEAEPDESVRVVRRSLTLDEQPHTLLVVERITVEILRHELQVWKKVIRLMTHELNNSITPISSLLHSALTIAGDPARRARLDEVLQVVGERVSSLAQFLAGYAQFARLPPPNRRPVEWKPFVARLSELSRFRCEGDLPTQPGVFDRAQLEQALLNLLKNAHESGSRPEEVSLRVTREPDGQTLVIVEDQGRGMDQEVLDRAIEPFYSRKPGGTGLGLALCREILEAHGGRLVIESKLGRGTRAICILPAR